MPKADFYALAAELVLNMDRMSLKTILDYCVEFDKQGLAIALDPAVQIATLNFEGVMNACTEIGKPMPREHPTYAAVRKAVSDWLKIKLVEEGRND